MANCEHVLALIRIHNRRCVFNLKAQSTAKCQSEEFVGHMDHLKASRIGDVTRYDVTVERGTAML